MTSAHQTALPRRWRSLSLATLCSLTFYSPSGQTAESGPWGPVASLRDDTSAGTGTKPAGGFYVTPIHAVLRARDGKVILTGTGRVAKDGCNGSTQRGYGLTFVLDPAQLDATLDAATLQVKPIDEQASDKEHHVLYCSGQIPLADGRVLYVAGTEYPRVLPISSPEYGLNYSRIFDPKTDTFTRITAPMKGGQSASPGMKWYPTNRLLPDGRVLIMGGYHWSVGGPGAKENRSLEIFDPAAWDADPKADPYTVMSQISDVPATINAAGRAYTHVFLLPKPVPAAKGGGLARTIALIGSQGDMWLYNHEPGPSAASRIIRPAKGTLPNPSGADKAEGSTSVMLPDGRSMTMSGGRDGPGSAVAHIYDPYGDKWEDLDLGIGRNFSTATWLPDGTVLLLNGYTSEAGSPWTYDNAPGGADGVRKPQIIDPFKKTVKNEEPWPEPTARGYHSVVLLLKDGRILIGGGKDTSHDTGCEKNEARIYSPPYLAAGPRPAITNVKEGQEIVVGGAPLKIDFSGTVRAARGVALMAPGGMTHSYNQNQRYVPLTVVSGPDQGSITVMPPATLNEAPPGEYLLHIVSEEGAPSVGVYVRVVAPPACVYPVDATAGVFIEAEGSSRRAGPFQRMDEQGRGNDAFIRVDPAAASAVDVPDEGNVMWYDIDVAKAGNAYLWLLGNGPAQTSDTVFVSLNGGPDQVVTLTPAAWGWTRAETALKLTAGKQTLKIKAGEAGAQLDRLWLTSDAAATAPDGLGAATPDTPCSKGQVLEPPSGGGSGGAGGSSSSGGAIVASGGSAGQVATGGSMNVGGGSTAGMGPGSGATSGGSSSGTTPTAEDGCGCRTVSSSQPGGQLLALLGLVSTAWVAARRRSRRVRGAERR
jgi:hypothetical protein